MIDSAGIWIDHHKALVVTLSADDEHTILIHSPLKGRHEAHGVPVADRPQRVLTAELNTYYDAVIATLRGYVKVLIFGPGEAKEELRRRMTTMTVGKSVTAEKAADQMTDGEIIAKVREHFGRGDVRPEPSTKRKPAPC